MSATSSGLDSLASSLLVLEIIIISAYLLFFFLFYYYLSQLVGINDSLKQIVLLMEDKWFPDDQAEDGPKQTSR